MEPAKNFRDLIVWMKAHLFVLGVYRDTEKFPRNELFGLSAQFRRAAVSIAANIAEGFKKSGLRDKVRIFNIAEGSVEECRYSLILSQDLGYKVDEKQMALLEEVSKLLLAYSAAIRRQIS